MERPGREARTAGVAPACVWCGCGVREPGRTPVTAAARPRACVTEG